jgi:hypothetical protein
MVKKLTKTQKKLLRQHSKHHTKKHMKHMVKLMHKGKTFKQAHMGAVRRGY